MIMRISKVSNQYVRDAKSFSVSSKYIFLYTGKKVIILDKQFNYITEISGLEYVYDGYLSPDESKLLMVSTVNKFYIVSLDIFLATKYIVKNKYNGNLEGHGCWSMIGNAVYIPIQNEKSMKSSLRKYYINDNSEYEDFLIEKFWIIHISWVSVKRKYLIIGEDRSTHCWHLIWYDENKKGFEDYIIQGFEDAIINIDVNEKEGILSILGAESNAQCDFMGEKCSTIDIPLEKQCLDFTDAFKIASLNDVEIEMLHDIPQSLQLHALNVTERINTLHRSIDLKYMYLGTTMGLIMVDVIDMKVVAKVGVEFGVQKIHELCGNMLICSTWNGIKVLKVDK